MSIIRQKRRVAGLRRLFIAFFVVLFLFNENSFARPPSEGLSKSEVIARYGEPLEKIEMAHIRKEVWRYPRRDVTFFEGKVLLPSESESLNPSKVVRAPKEKTHNSKKTNPTVSLGEVLSSLPKDDDPKNGQVSIPSGETSSIVQID